MEKHYTININRRFPKKLQIINVFDHVRKL